MNAETNLSLSQSSSKLAIQPRLVRFDYQDIESAQFHSENTVIAAYWVGLSATFPLGEAEFVKSVKLFEDQVSDEKLKAEIANFAAQESHHALQHKKLNKYFDSQGYNTAQVERTMTEKLDERALKWSNKKRLMRTVSAEHFTAVMAHHALSSSQAMESMPDSLRDLFVWHAIEEIEHKSVAFDVYQHCVGDMGALRRHYLHFAFIEFPFQMMLITRYLLKEIGHKTSWKDRRGMWRYLFGKGGIYSSCKHLYLMFLKKGFHPWQHDDSALVEEWKSTLEPHLLESSN